MLRAHIMGAIVSAGALTPQQQYFRTGHSTIDAIKEVIEAVRKEENNCHRSHCIFLLGILNLRNPLKSARWVSMLWVLEHSLHALAYD